MHGVGGDALCAVDGAGIAETGRLADVVGGQPDTKPAAVMSNSEVAAVAYIGDGPAVAVLDTAARPLRTAGPSWVGVDLVPCV